MHRDAYLLRVPLDFPDAITSFFVDLSTGRMIHLAGALPVCPRGKSALDHSTKVEEEGMMVSERTVWLVYPPRVLRYLKHPSHTHNIFSLNLPFPSTGLFPFGSTFGSRRRFPPNGGDLAVRDKRSRVVLDELDSG